MWNCSCSESWLKKRSSALGAASLLVAFRAKKILRLRVNVAGLGDAGSRRVAVIVGQARLRPPQRACLVGRTTTSFTHTCAGRVKAKSTPSAMSPALRTSPICSRAFAIA